MNEMTRYNRTYKPKITRNGGFIYDMKLKDTLVTLRQGDVIHYGISRCNRTDLFVKKEGRKLAKQRALDAAKERSAEMDGLYGTIKTEDIVKLLQYFEQI